MKMNKILTVAGILLLLISCKKLEDFNENTKAPSEVPAETLFSSGQKELADQITNSNVNLNIFRLYAQHWTETTYTDESNYNITIRDIPESVFRVYYRDILRDFREAQKVVEAEPIIVAEVDPFVKANKLAMIDLMMVYSYQRLVDIFGNIPYSEALDIEILNPKYDDAQFIYQDLMNRTAAAHAALNSGFDGFGNGDLIYGGDIEAWKKFAGSLMLKLAIHVSDVPELDPAGHVEQAISMGIFESHDDNATISYLDASPNTNAVYEDLVLSGRNDFVPANTLVDAMDSLNDPRMKYYFDDNITDSTGAVIYVGGTYGSGNTYSIHTHVSDRFRDPTLEGVYMDYTEVEFYMAEAAARGFISDDPATHYNNAIRSSIIYWGGTDAEADDYLSDPEVEYASSVAASGDWKETIGTQAWISYYNRGLLAWTVWRRLDAPDKLVLPTSAVTDAIPVRFFYPANEQTLNSSSYQAAVAAMGGDTQLIKLFWDKY